MRKFYNFTQSVNENNSTTLVVDLNEITAVEQITPPDQLFGFEIDQSNNKTILFLQGCGKQHHIEMPHDKVMDLIYKHTESVKL